MTNAKKTDMKQGKWRRKFDKKLLKRSFEKIEGKFIPLKY
jgi:hypothetical protein